MQFVATSLEKATRVGNKVGLAPAVNETELELTETKEIAFSVFKISVRRFTTRAGQKGARGRGQIEIQIVRPLSGGDLEIIGMLSSKRNSLGRSLTWGVWLFALETQAGVLGMRIKRGALFSKRGAVDESPGYFIS